MAAHREWTERHIRELIQAELKKLKADGSVPERMIRMIDLTNYFPIFETGGYSIGGLCMKKYFAYSVDKDTMRVECPVYSPGRFVYQQVPNVYSYDGAYIIGVTITPPVTQPPYWGAPEFHTQEHYDDLSTSGIPTLKNNHLPGIVVWKWSPYDENGEVKFPPFARLRDQEGHVADFSLKVIADAEPVSVESRTETMKGLRLGYVVGVNGQGLTDWEKYDFNYKDYYYPKEIMPGAASTNTICFYYYKYYEYAILDSYFVS